MECIVKMNKINDRDLTELSGYWVYQDINTNKEIKVNGKRFMQVDSYNDDKNRNLNGAADIKIYELLDDKVNQQANRLSSIKELLMRQLI